MKLSTLVLAASILGNVALALFLLGNRSIDSSSTSSSVQLASGSATNPAATRDRAAPSSAWSEIETDDLSSQRDRLRAEGFPPSAVRAILAAQIRQGFSAQRKAIEAAQGELPFWKNANSDPKIQAELRALSKQEQQAITALLGPDPENGSLTNLQRQLPGLFPEKIGELAAIRDRYNELRQDIYSRQTTAEDRLKVVELDKAQRDEIAALLTPQELEDYELRTSNTANSLRSTLSAFDATESEFLALYKLQSAFNDQFQTATLSSLPPDQQSAFLKQRSDAQKQMTEEIKDVLGPDRFAEYQRATDSNYRQTTQLVARLEMPVETANQVYAVQKDLQQRLQSLQTDRTLASGVRNAQLAALAVEAEQQITATLGPTGYEAYKTNGGSWMSQLQPRPSPTTAGPPGAR